MKVEIFKVGFCIFQIVGKSNKKDDEGCLVNAVAKVAEIAKKYKGIPQECNPHVIPTTVVVHATYQFRTETDAMHFLQECKKVKNL